MAVLYIAEYVGTAIIEGRGTAGIGDDTQLVAEQTVAIGGASAQSAAFNAATRMIRVHADAICSIATGANPTATATKRRMAAGQTEYFAVTPSWKIAVITNT